MPSAHLPSSPTAFICSSMCPFSFQPSLTLPQRCHELDRGSLCYQGLSCRAIHSNLPHMTLDTSSPAKAQVIPGTLTAGTGPRSLPPSSTAFSCWHSASPSRWKPWNASSARPVCCFLCRQSPPFNPRRHIQPSFDSHCRIIRPGFQHRRPIPFSRYGLRFLPSPI